jgi:hypothetical protein
MITINCDICGVSIPPTDIHHCLNVEVHLLDDRRKSIKHVRYHCCSTGCQQRFLNAIDSKVTCRNDGGHP